MSRSLPVLGIMLCAAGAAAQEASGPPPVITISREEVKVGRMAANEKVAAAYAAFASRTSQPSRWIGLVPLTGDENVSLFLSPYASFAAEIRAATAQARMKAEHYAFENDPRAWLEHGPGRDRPGDPGWTSSTRPGAGSAAAENLLANPELMDFLKRLLEGLEKFPDAHAHIVHMIADAEFRKKPDPQQGDSHDPSPSPVSQKRI